MKTVKVLDKNFKLYIPHDKIQEHIAKVAAQINNDLKGKDVIFMGILNGSFMFASDLMKLINLPSQITFLKLASYQGTRSTGSVKRLIGLNEDISGKTVVVIEDIVDTGITLEQIQKQLLGYEPAEIKYATLLFKPNAYQGKILIDYVGIEIPNDFILGYGLDYDGFGRNLADLYVLED